MSEVKTSSKTTHLPSAIRHTTQDAHKALFGDKDTTLAPKSLQELKQGIAQYIKRKHAHFSNPNI
jgi:hypothetical protein